MWLKGRTYGGETWYIYSIGVPHRFGKENNKTAKQPPSDKMARNDKLQIAPEWYDGVAVSHATPELYMSDQLEWYDGVAVSRATPEL